MPRLAFLPPVVRVPLARGLSRAIGILRVCRWAVKPNSGSPQVEMTALIPSAYDLRQPDRGLISLALQFANEAHTNDLPNLRERLRGHRAPDLARDPGDTAALVERWPGEPYRLLAAVMRVTQPTLSIEIGTYTGIGSLAMRDGMGKNGRFITYDIVPWTHFPDTVLSTTDFGPHFEQRIGNLADPNYFASQRDVMLEADVIYCDGPKDGAFEPAFMVQLVRDRTKPGLLIYDDCRLLTMVEFWRTLECEKLDLISFGHWTGTGLVRIGRIN